MTPAPIKDRIEAAIQRIPEAGCWLWGKSVGSHGYGQLMFPDKRPRLAHRLAYEEYVGPVPEGLQVLHRCDVRACCNPHHLFLGTPKDNMQDCKQKGRISPPPRGRNFKLTAKQRHEVKLRRLGGEDAQLLAREFGIDVTRVYQIARNK